MFSIFPSKMIIQILADSFSVSCFSTTMFIPDYIKLRTAKDTGSEKKEPTQMHLPIHIPVCVCAVCQLVCIHCKGLTQLSTHALPAWGDQHLKVWSSRTTIAPSGLGEGKQFCSCRPLTAGNTVQLSTVTYISY